MQTDRRLLANWQFAIATFHHLYKAIERALERSRSADCAPPSAGTPTAEDLERMRLEMIEELKWLLQNVNSPASCERLQQHIRRIKRQNQRAQQVIDALKP